VADPELVEALELEALLDADDAALEAVLLLEEDAEEAEEADEALELEAL